MRHVLFFLLMIVGTAAFSQDGAPSNQKVTTALINLKAGNGVNEGESEIISDRLRSELFKTGKVTIMERDQMQEILKEQGFQQSGACTDEACLVEMGQMLGVKHLVVGSLGKLGSMFMINVRAIDVQTSKVINVVSVDVKGEIEDLVNKLPYIANQLVNETKADVAQPAQTPPPEVAPEPQEELKPEAPETTTVAAVEKTEEQKPEPVKEIGKNKDKNENRFGVSFVLEIGGAPKHTISVDTLSDDGIALFDSVGYVKGYYSKEEYDYESTPLINLQVRFQLKMGPFLNMSIAPGFMFSKEIYSLKSENMLYTDEVDSFEINYAVPMIHFGLSYVKRIYPIKINVGGFLNFTMPVTGYTYTVYTLDQSNNIIDETREDSDLDLKLAPGLRAGVEFLIGAHFSIGAEGVWTYWPKYETKFNFDELGLEGFDTPVATQEIKYPPFKLGLNFNIYF
jgi:hypothetical protein